jgi:hypothetical protein
MGAEQPLLETVLTSRGILSEREVGAVSNALEVSRAEKLTIPGYKVTDVLGRGATSIVLRARHRREHQNDQQRPRRVSASRHRSGW